MREVPAGYWEGIKEPACQLQDPDMDALCDDVRLASRGPLFSRARAAAVMRLLPGDLFQAVTGRRP